jgi:hypothetical protein
MDKHPPVSVRPRPATAAGLLPETVSRRGEWRSRAGRLAAAPWWALLLGAVLALPAQADRTVATTPAQAVPAGATGAAIVDPPGRVGRVADLQGEVAWFDHEAGAWTDAVRNYPLTQGDRLATGSGARAELRVGSTVLRLGASTELEVLRLDDERMVFQLHAGSAALRVRTIELAEEIEFVTAEARLVPLRAGHYRLDRIDDSTGAGAWRGQWQVLGLEGLVIEPGEYAELWRQAAGRSAGTSDAPRPTVLRHRLKSPPADIFAAWVQRADENETRSAATRHVSPEMTGAEELERHGRWDRHPSYGAVWIPVGVASTWAPYRYGRWTHVSPWGWTWVDDAPWGFAPFHYGRWVHWHGRWAWAPGHYVARPVYSPGLVAWVGGSRWGVSVQVGAPVVGWVPLAPNDWYWPWYRSTVVYVDRVNHHPGKRPPRVRPGEPGYPTRPRPVDREHKVWTNQGAPGGVTVVRRDALERHRPVQTVAIDTAGLPLAASQPLPQATPPQRARPPAAVPGERGWRGAGWRDDGVAGEGRSRAERGGGEGRGEPDARERWAGPGAPDRIDRTLRRDAGERGDTLPRGLREEHAGPAAPASRVSRGELPSRGERGERGERGAAPAPAAGTGPAAISPPAALPAAPTANPQALSPLAAPPATRRDLPPRFERSPAPRGETLAPPPAGERMDRASTAPGRSALDERRALDGRQARGPEAQNDRRVVGRPDNRLAPGPGGHPATREVSRQASGPDRRRTEPAPIGVPTQRVAPAAVTGPARPAMAAPRPTPAAPQAAPSAAPPSAPTSAPPAARAPLPARAPAAEAAAPASRAQQRGPVRERENTVSNR